MTRDEIIRMAREAGLLDCDCCLPFWPEEDEENWKRFFVHFAVLVAAAERERFAAECIDLVAMYGGPVDLEAAIRARGDNNAS